MLNLLILGLCLLFIYGLIITNKFFLETKRRKIKRTAFPEKWKNFLESEVDLYRRLPLNLKEELHQHIKIFLAEKEFVGQEGLMITDTIGLTIASQACLLLLQDKSNQRNYFPYLKYIYVYPNHVTKKDHLKKKEDNEDSFLLGQSSVGSKSGKDGIIRLSWSQIHREFLSPNQGENVIIHEFAHQLDQGFGTATGTPRLPSLEDTLIWGEIFAQEYDKHYNQVMNYESTVIDSYGATNPVEFFAVVTETFFTKSRLLYYYHPLLYGQLKKYYGVDPVNWK